MDGLEKERARLVAAMDAADRRYALAVSQAADALQERREACLASNSASLAVYHYDAAQGDG